MGGPRPSFQRTIVIPVQMRQKEQPTLTLLPDRFDPHRFTSERIWGVLRDEFDVASARSL